MVQRMVDRQAPTSKQAISISSSVASPLSSLSNSEKTYVVGKQRQA